MSKKPDADDSGSMPVGVFNADGEGKFVLICDHASNTIPERWRNLGLNDAVLNSWSAYDPCAFDVAVCLAERLDIPLVYPKVSRLVIECNRPLNAPDLIAAHQGSVVIPGNLRVDEDERIERIETIYNVYHETIDAVVALRKPHLRGLISIHTFQKSHDPKSAANIRIGVASEPGEALVAPIIAELSRDDNVHVVIDRVVSPYDMIFHTIQRHGDVRGVPGVVFQLRLDEVETPQGRARWVDRIAELIRS